MNRRKQKSNLNKKQKEVVRNRNYRDMAMYANDCMVHARTYKMLCVFLFAVVLILSFGLFVMPLIVEKV